MTQKTEDCYSLVDEVIDLFFMLQYMFIEIFPLGCYDDIFYYMSVSFVQAFQCVNGYRHAAVHQRLF